MILKTDIGDLNQKLFRDTINYQRSDRQFTIDSANVNSDDDDDEVMIKKSSLNLMKIVQQVGIG